MLDAKPEEIGPDDPGLTAYALGELEGPEAVRYAEAVEKSLALQQLVREICSDAQMLSAELRREPVASVRPEVRSAVAAVVQSTLTEPVARARKSGGTHWIRWITITTASAAALTAVAVSLPRHRQADVVFQNKVQPLAAAQPASAPGAPYGDHADRAGDSVADESKSKHLGDNSVVDGASPTDVLVDALVKSEPQPSDAGIGNGGAPAGKSDFSNGDGKPGGDGGISTARVIQPSASTPPSSPRSSSTQFDLSPSVSNVAEPQTTWKELPKKKARQDQLAINESSQAKSPKGDPENPQSNRSKSGDSNAVEDDFEHNSGVINGAREKSPQRNLSTRTTDQDGSKRMGQSQRGDLRPNVQKRSTDERVDSEYVDSEKAEKGQKESGSSDQTGRVRFKESEQAGANGKQNGQPTDAKAKSDQVDPLYAKGRSAKAGDKSSPLSDEAPAQKDAKSDQLSLADLSKARESTRDPVKFYVEFREGIKGFRGEFEQLKRERIAAPDQTSVESYKPIYENSFVTPAQEPLSTFSIDVDSASYANVRRFLQSGQLPPADSVRIEELVNYFGYQYPTPQDGKPFSVNADIAACPWHPGHQLVRIGLKGKEIAKAERPASSLVFLVDVSGSMSAANKLPLVRSSLKTLVGQLDERDRIAIVTYAGEAGVRLPSTSLTQRDTILAAIDGLGAGGSTNGAAGINTAYDIAAQEFIEKGTNRVILCTDGDFNVGVTSDDALVQMIQTRAKGGVFLSIFGFGMGNLKDSKLEQLADKGNGQYGYIDDQQEAEKVFVQELSGTLVTIAKDVKIQIEFDKDAVAAYRQIGYENRVLAAEDFNNDKKDAGEIGAGHTVTALYEIVPIRDLKPTAETRWMNVKLRFKMPEASASELIEKPLTGLPGQMKLAPTDFQFAASVASFGMLLRNSQHAGQANWGMVKELAQAGLSNDQFGHRSAFRRLIDQAEGLVNQQRPASPVEPDASVQGKYKSLLRRLNVPEDAAKYGQFRDYGFDQTKNYGGADNLPEGYWVYVAPYWYIWGETAVPSQK